LLLIFASPVYHKKFFCAITLQFTIDNAKKICYYKNTLKEVELLAAFNEKILTADDWNDMESRFFDRLTPAEETEYLQLADRIQMQLLVRGILLTQEECATLLFRSLVGARVEKFV
jgi:hypothetical protein